MPEGPERGAWLARHGPDDATSRRILRLAELESLGTNVVAVAADLADPDSVRAALDEAEQRLGPLDGAVHAAGELRDRPIELATDEDHEVVLGAKARGAVVLADELERRGADLLVLISSTSTLLAPEGQASYVAANSVLDAMAGDRGSAQGAHDQLRHLARARRHGGAPSSARDSSPASRSPIRCCRSWPSTAAATPTSSAR